MNYPTHNTEWALSAKGNYWRRLDATPLIVGRRKDGYWWARRGDTFLRGRFPSKQAAMAAVEVGVDPRDWPDDDGAGAMS
jgi:hypothetical protein